MGIAGLCLGRKLPRPCAHCSLIGRPGFLRGLGRPLLEIRYEHNQPAALLKHGYHLVSAGVSYRDYVSGRNCNEYKFSVSMHFARREGRYFQLESFSDGHGSPSNSRDAVQLSRSLNDPKHL